MPLTKKLTAKAARLDALAVFAHQDDAAADDDEQAAIVQTARHAAQAGLERLGFDPTQLVHIADCVQAVRNW